MKVFTIAYVSENDPRMAMAAYALEKYVAQNKEEAISKYKARHKDDVFNFDDGDANYRPIVINIEDVYE